MEKQVKKWLGGDTCDICNQKIETFTFVDGKTVMGPWALMCAACHLLVGLPIGPGRGQRYDTKTKEKIAG